MASGNPHFEAEPIESNWRDGNIIIKPRNLNIVWGKDDRYWSIPEKNDNDKPAELLQVCWLEVTGSVDTDPHKSYEVIFELSLTPDAFGWGSYPIYIMVKRGKDGKFAWKKENLNNKGQGKFHITGKLMKSDSAKDTKLYFGLYEVWSGKWKGGLKIHGVTVKEI